MFAVLSKVGATASSISKHSNDEQLYDEEIVLQELERELNYYKTKLIKAENRNELFFYAIDKSVKKLEKNQIRKRCTPKTTPRTKPEIAMLDLSDIHLGKKIDHRDTDNISTYCQDVFEKQCDKLIQSIEEIIDIQRTGGVNVRHLYINCLGDLVDGEMIYGGHQSEIFMGTSDQLFLLGHYMVDNILVPLGELFDTVTVFSVDGNHGRVGKKNEGYDRKLNFDNHLLRIWQIRLFEHRDTYSFYISECPHMLYSLFGRLHLLAHGNNSGNGRWPMLGMERFLTGMSMLHRQVIDYVHLAHYHRDMKINFNFSEILVNGSWIGSTEFSVGKLFAGDYAFQRFYGINPDHITWSYNIYLDDHIKQNWIVRTDEPNLNVLTSTSKQFDPITIRKEHSGPPSGPLTLKKSMGN